MVKTIMGCMKKINYKKMNERQALQLGEILPVFIVLPEPSKIIAENCILKEFVGYFFRIKSNEKVV